MKLIVQISTVQISTIGVNLPGIGDAEADPEGLVVGSIGGLDSPVKQK